MRENFSLKIIFANTLQLSIDYHKSFLRFLFIFTHLVYYYENPFIPAKIRLRILKQLFKE